jgi:hypothetical protein
VQNVDDQHYTIKFLDQDINVDSTTGRPIDVNSFTFVNDAVVKWSNDVDVGDWKALKVRGGYLNVVVNLTIRPRRTRSSEARPPPSSVDLPN